MTALSPGSKGVDYSGARPSPASVVKAGGRFIVRYSAGVGNAQPKVAWKLCGPGEIAAATAAGLDFFANSEWYESRITEGVAAGRADGAADLAFWKSRGLAKGASIFVSWDQAPARSKWDAAIDYLQAYGQALGGYYHVDCYAGDPFLRHALALNVIRYGWRPNAGSWSGDGLPYQPADATAHLAAAQRATVAALWQTGNYWFDKGADEDLVLRVPTGSHLQAIAGMSGVTTEGDDLMPIDPKERAALIADIAEEVWARPMPSPNGHTYTAQAWLVGANVAAHQAVTAVGKLASAVAGVSAMVGQAGTGVLARVASLQKAVTALKPSTVEDADAEKVAARVVDAVRAIWTAR